MLPSTPIIQPGNKWNHQPGHGKESYHLTAHCMQPPTLWFGTWKCEQWFSEKTWWGEMRQEKVSVPSGRCLLIHSLTCTFIYSFGGIYCTPLNARHDPLYRGSIHEPKQRFLPSGCWHSNERSQHLNYPSDNSNNCYEEELYGARGCLRIREYPNL
jgi:hypothetical protein